MGLKDILIETQAMPGLCIWRQGFLAQDKKWFDKGARLVTMCGVWWFIAFSEFSFNILS
jgi:hypothetical protein